MLVGFTPERGMLSFEVGRVSVVTKPDKYYKHIIYIYTHTSRIYEPQSRSLYRKVGVGSQGRCTGVCRGGGGGGGPCG